MIVNKTTPRAPCRVRVWARVREHRQAQRTKASKTSEGRRVSKRENRYVIKVIKVKRKGVKGAQFPWFARTKRCTKPFKSAIIM
jgi:hypothetical protein